VYSTGSTNVCSGIPDNTNTSWISNIYICELIMGFPVRGNVDIMDELTAVRVDEEPRTTYRFFGGLRTSSFGATGTKELTFL